MKLLTLIFSFVCLAAFASAQASEEKPVRVVGIVSLEVFSGRPNYESVKDGDEAEQAWILTVANAEKKERFQLVVIDGAEQKFATLRQCVGKQVVVEGSVWEAYTGHHHTPLLISVRTIKEQPIQRITDNSGASPLRG
jgi:hypothetical protein